MNILSLTAGTGSVYAGSGLRDNTLAAEETGDKMFAMWDRTLK